MPKAIEIGTEVLNNGRRPLSSASMAPKHWDLKVPDQVRGTEFIASGKQLGLN